MPAKLRVVMGKGGVGKSTVAAALALGHAEQGARVGLASLTGTHALAGAVRRQWGGPPASLELLELEPRRLVDDVVAKLMPLPALTPLLTAHPAYDAVYRIAPGVKELAVLHRLVVLSEQGGLDLLVVDGLATGHGTHFLETPRKSADILTGRLAERARELDAVLMDPARASVVLAATLEEMPVRETVELAARLRAGRFAVEAVVANRVRERLLPSPMALAVLDALGERAAASQVGSDIGASWGMVQRMVRAASHVEHSAREMEPLLTELRALGVPVVGVPYLPREEGRLRAVAPRLREAGL